MPAWLIVSGEAKQKTWLLQSLTAPPTHTPINAHTHTQPLLQGFPSFYTHLLRDQVTLAEWQKGGGAKHHQWAWPRRLRHFSVRSLIHWNYIISQTAKQTLSHQPSPRSPWLVAARDGTAHSINSYPPPLYLHGCNRVLFTAVAISSVRSMTAASKKKKERKVPVSQSVVCCTDDTITIAMPKHMIINWLNDQMINCCLPWRTNEAGRHFIHSSCPFGLQMSSSSACTY